MTTLVPLPVRGITQRQRKAIVAIGAATAGNPAKRLSSERLKAIVGKNATNIVDSLLARGILDYQVTTAAALADPPGRSAPAGEWYLSAYGERLFAQFLEQARKFSR